MMETLCVERMTCFRILQTLQSRLICNSCSVGQKAFKPPGKLQIKHMLSVSQLENVRGIEDVSQKDIICWSSPLSDQRTGIRV